MWKILAVDNFLCYNRAMEIEKYLGLIKEEYFEKFELFKNLLIESNKICNITSILDEKGILYKHFLDSIAGESLFLKGAEVVEIGSGGGFPSIPLKIIREDLKLTLIESTSKKCTYLNGVVDKLKLDCVQVLNLRAEEGAHKDFLREKFDIACARAVAKLNTLCEYCLPYVKLGGKFVAYKGNCNEELDEAKNAIKILGGEIENILNYELPEDNGKRCLVVIKKIKPTPSLYPRGHGMERKKPL